jgi:hypothetical protein
MESWPPQWEDGGLAVALEICIRDVLGSNLGQDTVYPDIVFVVSLVPKKNDGIVLRLC